MTSIGETACTYATLILHDDGIPITAEKIATLLKSANVTVEPYWPGLFVKLAQKKNLGELVENAAVSSGPASVAMAAPESVAAPAVEEKKKKKKEEPEEDSDEDMPGLFDIFE